jgi:hypothetical protein
MRSLPSLRALRSFPHFRRRHAITAAEGAVEVGDVTKPGIIGDRADAPVSVQRVDQHAMRTGQPFGENAVGECGARFRE